MHWWLVFLLTFTLCCCVSRFVSQQLASRHPHVHPCDRTDWVRSVRAADPRPEDWCRQWRRFDNLHLCPGESRLVSWLLHLLRAVYPHHVDLMWDVFFKSWIRQSTEANMLCRRLPAGFIMISMISWRMDWEKRAHLPHFSRQHGDIDDHTLWSRCANRFLTLCCFYIMVPAVTEEQCPFTSHIVKLWSHSRTAPHFHARCLKKTKEAGLYLTSSQ